MSNSLVVLGRQPAIGVAELESLYGASGLSLLGRDILYIEREPVSIDFKRLGGAIKLCEIIGSFKTTQWREIQQELVELANKNISADSDGKIQVGISVHGLKVTSQQIMAAGLTLKKTIRKRTGRTARIVPNKEQTLNSAQVLHNHLLPPSFEFVLVRDGSRIICGRTVAVQNINDYTIRDRSRPKRDARVGMLPPKLAQIIINLATGPESKETKTLLDPFCGTGVILQEAMLMDRFEIMGSDIDPRMIEYSGLNLRWLQQHYDITTPYSLSVGDATQFMWPKEIGMVACETYLGQPFNTVPSTEKIEQVRNVCNVIIEHFLLNIAKQLKPGIRLSLAVPTWQTGQNQFVHLPLLDHLAKLGYNRLSFEHALNKDLIYCREDQIVGRELLVITRK